MSDEPTQYELIDRAVDLLIAAAYGNPIVRRAVDQVEAEIRRLRAESAELQVIAAEAWANAGPQVSYGSFPGGDPRNFRPDEECCTAEEIEAWKVACCEWECGRGVDRGPGCQTMGDGSVVTGTGFGIGTYTWNAPGAAL